MTQIVRFELDGGGSVFVEVPDDGPTAEPGGWGRSGGPVGQDGRGGEAGEGGPDGRGGRGGRVVDTGRSGQAVQTASETLQTALVRMRPAIEAVVGQVRGLAAPPDRVSVQFGIKITAEAGAVIAKAATEANFTVSAEWARDSTPRPPAPRLASEGS
ncbi:CU044_2847 family protein [Streptomyces sp. NPDC004647]|uniref:CU044_2847 family protein n=1 Tax=Streptomyces sp. NPDC004647 TaxID=3154671 RepID=UPI0033AF2C6C